MSLSIQERLKDLRVERGLTLGQLAEQTGLSKSALGSYETEDFKDISHYALIRLAKFYGVTADYLLGLSEMKNHPNADLADLRLSDEMIDLLNPALAALRHAITALFSCRFKMCLPSPAATSFSQQRRQSV